MVIFALNYSCSFLLLSTNSTTFNWSLLMGEIPKVPHLGAMQWFRNSVVQVATVLQEGSRDGARLQGTKARLRCTPLADHIQPGTVMKTRTGQGWRLVI